MKTQRYLTLGLMLTACAGFIDAVGFIELGGFYTFAYSVMWGEELRDPATALRACRDANAGLNAFRMSTPS